MSKLLNWFPDTFKPNDSQITILNEIDKAFDAGHKFVVCCAPTGSGKSFITKTISNTAAVVSENFKELITSYAAFKQQHGGGYASEEECLEEKPAGAFVLTITKTLQDQYKQLFDSIDVLKGKSNYQCDVDKDFTVETAPCLYLKGLKEDCWSKDRCPYYNARNKALISQLGALNYNMFFSLPDHVKNKEYIICDEASELEDQLVKQFTCNIEYDILKKSKISIPAFDNLNHNTIYKWINTIQSRIAVRVDELKTSIASNKNKVAESKIKEYSLLRNLHSKITTLLETWHDCEYIHEGVLGGINFIPLKVDKLSQYIFKHGKKIIFLSATIIDHANFCKTLGISNYKYIEVNSTFNPKNAPIYVNTKTKLSYNNLEKNLPVIVKQIKSICEHHKDVKGIIHTHTNAITKYLKNNIRGSRFIFREPGVNNEQLIELHNNENNSVMVSPSMLYGVDLKDELARFQIIVKAPFLPIKDVRVARIMQLDRNWYQNKMLGALIQACGRGVRSQDDYCATYILDGTIIEKVIESKSKLPKYFLERFV